MLGRTEYPVCVTTGKIYFKACYKAGELKSCDKWIVEVSSHGSYDSDLNVESLKALTHHQFKVIGT